MDQLSKFNGRLADLARRSDPHTIDGIVLTKMDTIDDKARPAALHAPQLPLFMVMLRPCFKTCGQYFGHLACKHARNPSAFVSKVRLACQPPRQLHHCSATMSLLLSFLRASHGSAASHLQSQPQPSP